MLKSDDHVPGTPGRYYSSIKQKLNCLLFSKGRKLNKVTKFLFLFQSGKDMKNNPGKKLQFPVELMLMCAKAAFTTQYRSYSRLFQDFVSKAEL